MRAFLNDNRLTIRALRGTLLLGTALFVSGAFATAPAQHPSGKQAAKPPAGSKVSGKTAAAHKKLAAPVGPGPLADFGKVTPTPDVAQVANWISYTYNSGKRPFFVIDKKAAELYVFDGRGKLKGYSPVLLGKAVGDTSAPGVGDKRLSQLKESEMTTPAGRFFALRGKDTRGANVIWIDYKAAVSMHKVVTVGNEHRIERLASADPGDNRISNGCVNVPPRFFDSVLQPIVNTTGAYIYVLPETTTPQRLFGSYDVRNGKSVAVAKK